MIILPYNMLGFKCIKHDNEEEQIPLDSYVSKTGTIAEAYDDSQWTRVWITLDQSAERIRVCDVKHLGFFAERSRLEPLVSRTLWTLGRVWFQQVSPSGKPLEVEGFEVPPTTAFKVTGVLWGMGGDNTSKLYLAGVLGDGRQSALAFRDKDCLVPGLHRWESCEQQWSYTTRFADQELQKLHPTWSPETWKLIRQGIVAIGMTMDMVYVTCAGALFVEGAEMNADGTVDRILMCNGRRFQVHKDRVVKYVPEPKEHGAVIKDQQSAGN